MICHGLVLDCHGSTVILKTTTQVVIHKVVPGATSPCVTLLTVIIPHCVCSTDSSAAARVGSVTLRTMDLSVSRRIVPVR